MSTPPTTVIAFDDLRVVANAMLLRLPLRTPETRRVARLRELLDASSELSRLLAAQTHCSRVHCQGSHGTGDLLGDTTALYEALAAFGALTHEIACEYRRLVDAPVPAEVDLSLDGAPSVAGLAAVPA